MSLYNNEDAITWNELSPSLQELFKTLQSQITVAQTSIDNIDLSPYELHSYADQTYAKKSQLPDLTPYAKKTDLNPYELHSYADQTYAKKGDIPGVVDNHYLIKFEKGANGWYRKYSDGWIEQGRVVGPAVMTSNSNINFNTITTDPVNSNNTFNFMIPFTQKIYTFLTSTNQKWPSGMVPRAYFTSLSSFYLGMDSWGGGWIPNYQVYYYIFAEGI